MKISKAIFVFVVGLFLCNQPILAVTRSAKNVSMVSTEQQQTLSSKAAVKAEKKAAKWQKVLKKVGLNFSDSEGKWLNLALIFGILGFALLILGSLLKILSGVLGLLAGISLLIAVICLIVWCFKKLGVMTTAEM